MERSQWEIHFFAIDFEFARFARQSQPWLAELKQHLQAVFVIRRCQLRRLHIIVDINAIRHLWEFDHVAARTVVLRQQEFPFDAVLIHHVRRVDVLLSRWLSHKAENKRRNGLDFVFLERELWHTQTFVVALGFRLHVIVGSRSTQLLPEESRTTMMQQAVVKERLSQLGLHEFRRRGSVFSHRHGCLNTIMCG